jgi:hypothetical protein
VSAENLRLYLYDLIFRSSAVQGSSMVVPVCSKIHWYIKMNLPEAVHLCELRTEYKKSSYE